MLIFISLLIPFFQDVDIVQCYELFHSYATYEYKGTKETLEVQLIFLKN